MNTIVLSSKEIVQVCTYAELMKEQTVQWIILQVLKEIHPKAFERNSQNRNVHGNQKLVIVVNVTQLDGDDIDIGLNKWGNVRRILMKMIKAVFPVDARAAKVASQAAKLDARENKEESVSKKRKVVFAD
jgi:hypothetical protein